MGDDKVKLLATIGLVAMYVFGFLLLLFLYTATFFVTVDPSPYAFHALIIGTISIIFLLQTYTKFWKKRWGTKATPEPKQ